jgi:hypothetical protein
VTTAALSAHDRLESATREERRRGWWRWRGGGKEEGGMARLRAGGSRRTARLRPAGVVVRGVRRSRLPPRAVRSRPPPGGGQ